MAARLRPPKNETTPIDMPVLISARDRVKWKRQRERLGLSTREFAVRANTTHGTVSNIESGFQPTLKRSMYIDYLRALYREKTIDEIAKLADLEIERTKKLVTRIAMSTLSLDNDGLEHAAKVLELLAQKAATSQQ